MGLSACINTLRVILILFQTDGSVSISGQYETISQCQYAQKVINEQGGKYKSYICLDFKGGI